ncbi:MAG: hypothetical protein SFW64_02185 [Alphaproteobacteria bacterium]|nr:hypothetical protein [Alphaproteobacteria bacterium]
MSRNTPPAVDAQMIARISEGIAAGAATAIAEALRNKVPLVVSRDGKIIEVSLSELEEIQRRKSNEHQA